MLELLIDNYYLRFDEDILSTLLERENLLLLHHLSTGIDAVSKHFSSEVKSLAVAKPKAPVNCFKPRSSHVRERARKSGKMGREKGLFSLSPRIALLSR